MTFQSLPKLHFSCKFSPVNDQKKLQYQCLFLFLYIKDMKLLQFIETRMRPVTMMLRGNQNFTWIPPCTYLIFYFFNVTKKAPIFDRLPSLCTLRACNSGASNQGMQHFFEYSHTPKSYCTKKKFKKSADSERVSREELPNLSV